MNNNKLTDREVELIESARRALNEEFDKHFSDTNARQIYELIKLLVNSKSQEFICRICRGKTGIWICPCKICASQDNL